jgi:hypothetical protein
MSAMGGEAVKDLAVAMVAAVAAADEANAGAVVDRGPGQRLGRPGRRRGSSIP